MAIAYFSVKILGRVDKATGRQNSVVAAAAYRSGTKLYDERTESWKDYTKRQGVAYTAILAPENTPANLLLREKLWNTADGCENRKDAQLCRQYDFALPRELTLEQNIALAHEYGIKCLVSKGMIVDMSIHDHGDGNPHVHYLATMRELEKDGFGKKCREWNSKEMLMGWRQGFEDITNKHLRENGHEVQISAKSYEDQGVDKKPMIHMGNAATQLERKGIKTAKGDYNRQVAEENRQVDEVNKQLAEAGKEKEQLKKEIAEEQEQKQAQIEHDIKQEQKPETSIPTRLVMGVYPIVSRMNDLYAEEAKRIEEEKRQAERAKELAEKQASERHNIEQEPKPSMPIIHPMGMGGLQALYAEEAKKMEEEKRQAEKQVYERHNIKQEPKPSMPIIHPMGMGGLHRLHAEEAEKMEEERRKQGQTEHVPRRGIRTTHHTGRDEADDLYKREARKLHMEDESRNGRDPPAKQR